MQKPVHRQIVLMESKIYKSKTSTFGLHVQKINAVFLIYLIVKPVSSEFMSVFQLKMEFIFIWNLNRFD